MKVLYDYQIFTSQMFGGISRYFYELIRNMPDGIDYELPIAYSNNLYLQDNQIVPVKSFFKGNKFKGQTTWMEFFNKRLQKEHFHSKFDLFHPTYYNPYFLNGIGTKPFVLTIHDMTHELFSLKTDKNDWSVTGKKILAEKADRIIAVSENTKKDIIDILQINPDKIEVIYHGCSLKPNHTKNMKLPEKFILYVGDRSSYKNFGRLTEAFSQIYKEDSELMLICTGKPFSKNELEVFSNLGILNNVFNYNASDNQLAELYSSALAFVFPSLYEGFGIPILEAFTCGSPLVLSNTSCFPEIAGDAGEYFDPTNIDSISQALKTVVYNDKKRSELIEKGFDCIKKFSWEETAHKTALLYRSTINL